MKYRVHLTSPFTETVKDLDFEADGLRIEGNWARLIRSGMSKDDPKDSRLIAIFPRERIFYVERIEVEDRDA